MSTSPWRPTPNPARAEPVEAHALALAAEPGFDKFGLSGMGNAYSDEETGA